MDKKDFVGEYSWEEKYWHVYNCYCANWNSTINFIFDNYGQEALDRYFNESMNMKDIGKSTFADVKPGCDVKEFLSYYIGHHVMLEGNVEIEHVDEDKVVINVSPCGSKSRLVNTFGGDKVKHYCRHCELFQLWDQIGWHNEVDKTQAEKIDGENIGCKRTFTRIK